jgi:myosin heavy subunit
MTEVKVHLPTDLVYVRDEQYSWLPGVVEEVQDHQVLVRIDLPNEWYKTTILHQNTSQNKQDKEEVDKRWVQLKDYCNHHLPIQNNVSVRGCRDMNELEYINEAEMLYHLKERHCRLEKPYTRVGNILVAINPCRYISSLYTLSQQQLYVEKIIKSPLTSGTCKKIKKMNSIPLKNLMSISFT